MVSGTTVQYSDLFGAAPATEEMVAGLAEMAVAIFIMEDEQKIITLLLMWGRLVGERTAALSVRMDAHAHATAEGLGIGVDVVMVVVAAVAASTIRTALATILSTTFTVRAVEELEGTAGDGVTNDKTLGGWSAGGCGKKLAAPPGLVVGGMLSAPKNPAGPLVMVAVGMLNAPLAW